MRASLLLVLGLLNFASAIWFEVPLGVQKCLREDLSPEVLVKGYFNVTPIWGSSNLRVTISDPSGNLIYTKNAAESGSFAFTSDQPGEHSFCFQDLPVGENRPIQPRQVNLEIETGTNARDFLAEQNALQKDQIKPIELEVLKMEEYVREIKKEMRYLRKREEQMRVTNESTNSRVLWLSLLSLTFLIGSTVWQIFYLKRYFQKKKII